MVDPAVLGFIGFCLVSAPLALLGSWCFFRFISDRLATATLVGLWAVMFLLSWDIPCGWRKASRTALVYKLPGGPPSVHAAPPTYSVHLWGPWHLRALKD
jgi:hypothetical protein